MAPVTKGASPAEWKAEFERVARETGVESLLGRKELNTLPSFLETDERILAFTTGVMENSTWLITLTDRRILFLQKKLFGMKRAVIGLDSVTTVLGHKGLFFEEIAICNGLASKVIEKVWENTSADFTWRVRTAIAERKRNTREQEEHPKYDDPVSRFERLEALLKRGLLTREEFESESAALLREHPELKQALKKLSTAI